MFETIVTSFVTVAVALFAAWKLVLEKYLDTQLAQLRSNLEKERLQLQHEQELTRERLVSSLSLDAEKSQLLLQSHIEALEELWVAAAKLQRLGLSYQLKSGNNTSSSDDAEQLLQHLREFWNLYWQRRLHLTPALDEKFRELHTAVMRAKADTDTANQYKAHASEYHVSPEWDSSANASEYSQKAWTRLTNTVPELLDALRAHYFRVMAPLRDAEDEPQGVRALVQANTSTTPDSVSKTTNDSQG